MEFPAHDIPFRIGYGEDAHRLEAGRPLWLGGIVLEDSPHGAVAHSDGDALLHALTDALLSSASLGDIGSHFPDTDPHWKDASSAMMLEQCLRLVRQQGFEPINAALVLTLDRPRLGPVREGIVASVARLLGLERSNVGLSFKTSEGLAPQHVQARATVLMRRVS